MNHVVNESPESIALQWIQAVSSVSMRPIRATHVVVFYTKCFGTLDAKLVILAFPVARMRSVILPCLEGRGEDPHFPIDNEV
jgi:hypothetical protein